MSKSEYRQGIFKPTNPSKCVNDKPIRYLSSYEFKFMRWCDLSSNVLQWGSENVIIPYQSPVDKKIHRYYLDNWIVIKDSKGELKKFLVEIKPSRQTNPPIKRKGQHKKTVIYEQMTWEVNQAKWNAAMNFCKSKGIEFILLTEKHLGIK